MRMGRCALFILMAALVVGCSTAADKAKKALESPIEVDTKAEPGADFGKYRTWSVVPLKTGVAADPRLNDPEVIRSFADAVELEMFARGYRKVEMSDSSDLLLNVHATIGKIDAAYIQEYYDGSYAPGYRPEINGEKLASEWDEGTLIIILFDAKTRQGVWASRARAEVFPNLDAQTRSQRIAKAVAMMMESLPAQK